MNGVCEPCFLDDEAIRRKSDEEQTEAETLAWLALTQPAAHAQLQATLAERDAQRQAQARQQQDQQAAADQVCYLLTDPLGTPQEAYSPDGRCLWQARYKAWGRIFKLDHAAIHQPCASRASTTTKKPDSTTTATAATIQIPAGISLRTLLAWREG